MVLPGQPLAAMTPIAAEPLQQPRESDDGALPRESDDDAGAGRRLYASATSLHSLPDELLLRVLWFLDVNDLFSTSRTSRHLRVLSLDPLLHKGRLQYSHNRVAHFLPRRPSLHTLQPPISTIYLTRTHLAARRLDWSLWCIRLNRCLSRRPKLSTLVSANILPKECCKRDRHSGDFIWCAGTIFERKRKVEIAKIKEGLQICVERKAREIRSWKKDAGVGVLIWRFSRRVKIADGGQDALANSSKNSNDKVSSLRRFWEGLGNGKP